MSYWCEMCGELEAVANPFPWIPGGEARAHRAGCQGGRVIPIATLCSEPTVIDESDLAPGMVVVGVDEFGVSCEDAWLCDPQTWMMEDGFSCSRRYFHMEDGDFTVGQVRRIAGRRRRC